MKYIITGGSSFIGVSLTNLLLEHGHEIFVVCRSQSKTNGNIPLSKNVHVVNYEDLSDIVSIKDKIDAADVFIHLAWCGTSHEGRHDKVLQDDNIKYSLLSVDVAKDLGCKLYVEAGSQAEYGFILERFDEETPCHPDNEYGRAKLEFGRLASQKCQSIGMKFIHLRIVSIYGATDHLWTLVMSSVRKMLVNEDVDLSSCEQLWNFICIEDAVKQMYLLCENAIKDNTFSSEIYLIGSNDTRKLRSFVEEMRILTKSHSKLNFGSYTPANTVSLNPCMDKTEKATGGFVFEHTFGEEINRIINNYKNKIYD